MKIEDLSEKEIEIIKKRLENMPAPTFRGMYVTENPAIQKIIDKYDKKN